MTKMRRYDYADEKLTQARGTLMAPHGRGGEDGAFVGAFEIISRLQPRDVSDLPEPASDYWAKISALDGERRVGRPEEGRNPHDPGATDDL